LLLLRCCCHLVALLLLSVSLGIVVQHGRGCRPLITSLAGGARVAEVMASSGGGVAVDRLLTVVIAIVRAWW
jgi:hypothetical protein